MKPLTTFFALCSLAAALGNHPGHADLSAISAEEAAWERGMVGVGAADVAASSAYTAHRGINCFMLHGGTFLKSGISAYNMARPAAQCEAFCDQTEGCYCVVTDGNASAPGCWLRASCEPAACEPQAQYTAYIKPGAPPPPPPLPATCGQPVSQCIFNPEGLLTSVDFAAEGDPVGACCRQCQAQAGCTAWAVDTGFGRSVCNLYSGTAGELRPADTTMCVSAALPTGTLPPPPPAYPPPPQPPKAGAPCKDCPNILLMFTDDQDLVLGGWDEVAGYTPMRQTLQKIAARGATATEWRIATPICAPSRSEMQSGRYYMNVMNAEPTP